MATPREAVRARQKAESARQEKAEIVLFMTFFMNTAIESGGSSLKVYLKVDDIFSELKLLNSGQHMKTKLWHFIILS